MTEHPGKPFALPRTVQAEGKEAITAMAFHLD
jgi:hypothetical protein